MYSVDDYMYTQYKESCTHWWHTEHKCEGDILTPWILSSELFWRGTRFSHASLIFSSHSEFVIISSVQVFAFESFLLQHVFVDLDPAGTSHEVTFEMISQDRRSAIFTGWLPGYDAWCTCDVADYRSIWWSRFLCRQIGHSWVRRIIDTAARTAVTASELPQTLCWFHYAYSVKRLLILYIDGTTKRYPASHRKNSADMKLNRNSWDASTKVTKQHQ